MSDDDLINEIVRGAKAQQDRATRAMQSAQDQQNEELRRRQAAHQQFETFEAEFQSMIDKTNVAIAEGGIELMVRREQADRSQPRNLGRFTVLLYRNNGGGTNASLAFNVGDSGDVTVAKRVFAGQTAAPKLNILDTPMSGFRDVVLQFLREATSA